MFYNKKRTFYSKKHSSYNIFTEYLKKIYVLYNIKKHFLSNNTCYLFLDLKVIHQKLMIFITYYEIVLNIFLICFEK